MLRKRFQLVKMRVDRVQKVKIAWAVCSEEWRCRSEKEENEEGGEMGWGREGEAGEGGKRKRRECVKV